MIDKDDTPQALRPFTFHGIDFVAKSGDDYIADCPFCEKERALAVNKNTGQWTCHSKDSTCGKHGNINTFLEQLSEKCNSNTTIEQWNELSDVRGIPAYILSSFGMGYHEDKERWIIPIVNVTGKVHDLKAYTGKKLMGTAGCKSTMWNSVAIKNAKTVWICEGEWDGMAMSWLLEDQKDQIAIAIPGARVFKEDWSGYFKGKNVVVCGDNDEDGDKMAKKVWTVLHKEAASIKFLNWPEDLPSGYDIRDFVNTYKGTREHVVYTELLKLVSARHRRMPWGNQSNIEAAQTGVRESERSTLPPTITFEEVLKEYRNHLYMTPDLVMTLKLIFAVHMSTAWSGDPLWMFVVGAPGSGKTELLLSVSEAPDTVYYSSVDAKALCSGFQGSNDPSLIPQMIGRCAVFKDWTELLDANPFDLKKTYGVFRGMYDGQLERSYGNAVVRKYNGTFSLLAGVTNKIHAFSEATVGERFLKVQLKKPKKAIRECIMDKAMDSVAREGEKSRVLREIAKKFLDRRVDLPNSRECTGKYRDRIYAISELVSALRNNVIWNQCGSEREVTFRPESELPSRLSKQLTKLAMSATVMLGLKTMNDEVWKMIERVAVNTAYGYNMDIVEAVMLNGGRDVMLKDIETWANIPQFTMNRKIEELKVTGVLNVSKHRGLKDTIAQTKVSVSPSIREFWKLSGISSVHVGENGKGA